MKAAFILFLGAILAACAGNPAQQGPAELPASERATTSDAETRARAHTELGMHYFQVGNMGVALQEARTAIDADAGYAPAHNLLALVHMAMRETGPAQASFERAIRLAPGDPDIGNNYGLFLCENGRMREGIEQLMSAVKNPLYKTPARSYANAGLCYLTLKDDKAAEEQFRRAALADRGSAQAFFHLADIAFRHGDYYSAKKNIAEVHRIKEPDAESLWLAVRIERKIGDRQAEASFSAQIRRKFAGTPQHQSLMQGRYE